MYFHFFKMSFFFANGYIYIFTRVCVTVPGALFQMMRVTYLFFFFCFFFLSKMIMIMMMMMVVIIISIIKKYKYYV